MPRGRACKCEAAPRGEDGGRREARASVNMAAQPKPGADLVGTAGLGPQPSH